MLDLSSLRRRIRSRILKRIRTCCSAKGSPIRHDHDAIRSRKRRRLLQRLRVLLIEPLERRLATGSLIPIPLAMISDALDTARYPLPNQGIIIDPATTPRSSDQQSLSELQTKSTDPASSESTLDQKSSTSSSSQNPFSSSTPSAAQASFSIPALSSELNRNTNRQVVGCAAYYPFCPFDFFPGKFLRCDQTCH